MSDKVIGGILGAVYGDAFGVPFEMWSHDFLQKKLDSDNCFLNKYFVDKNKTKIINDFVKTHKNDYEGEYSDDSVLSLATIKSILQCGQINIDHMFETFCDEYSTNKNRGWGTNTEKILSDRKMPDGQKSESDGGLMRILPVIFWSTDTDMKENIVDVLRITNHDSEKSIQCCLLYSKLIKTLLVGDIDVNHFTQLIMSSVKNLSLIENNISDIVQNFLDENKGEMTVVEKLENYTTDCLIILQKVLNAVLYHFDDPIAAVAYGVSYGGDTDTIGTLIGGLMGVLHGSSSFVNKKIENYQNIEKIAKEFSTLLEFKISSSKKYENTVDYFTDRMDRIVY
jgi:ADP-ribosylglycohydrolase